MFTAIARFERAERHPVADRVLRNTLAQTVLLRSDALRDTMADPLSMDEPRKRFAAMMAGRDIRSGLGEGHPLLGRRMPDLDLVTANGSLRVVTFQGSLGGTAKLWMNRAIRWGAGARGWFSPSCADHR